MTTADLERRYQRLMRFYPPAYRAQRSGELIDTLLQGASPDQRRPGARDTFALVTGGLRARAGVEERVGLAANVRISVLFAVILYAAGRVIYDLIDPLTLIGYYGAQGYGPYQWTGLVSGLLALAIAVLLWRRRLRAGLIVAILAAVGTLFPLGGWINLGGPLIAVALVAWLARSGDVRRIPRSWGWFGMTFLVLQYLFVRVEPGSGLTTWLVLQAVFTSLGLLTIVGLWAMIDARLAIAVASYFAITTIGVVASEVAFSVFVSPTPMPIFNFQINGLSANEAVYFYPLLLAVSALGAERLQRQAAL